MNKTSGKIDGMQMQRLFTTILFCGSLLWCQFAVAQKLATVTNRLNGKRKYQSYTEKYQVLKSDRTTKQGFYELYDYKENLVTEGWYKSGKKDSLWREYNFWNHYVTASGQYREDVKTGIWVLNKAADTVELKYDYDHQKVLYCSRDPAKKFKVLQGADTIEEVPDQPPIYLGGSAHILKLFFDNLEYPDQAREKSASGRVLVAFTIFPDGHASSPWLLKGVEESLDQEAIRVAQLLPPDWLPALLNGQPLTSVFVMPVLFKLE